VLVRAVRRPEFGEFDLVFERVFFGGLPVNRRRLDARAGVGEFVKEVGVAVVGHGCGMDSLAVSDNAMSLVANATANAGRYCYRTTPRVEVQG
jgi:hypothetical protein